MGKDNINMKNLPYEIIVGLEIHVELNTTTKMFCRCLNDPFNSKPNTNICPNCSGLPGAMPVPNMEAVRKSIMVGKALNSTIAKLSKWDRKHYFYPDLPKGYQISQYDLPLCVGGRLELLDSKGEVEAVLNFERAHLEEDAGKLMHGGQMGYTNVDLNRAGVPLLEMVSKPDIRSAEQARRYMQELRLLARTLGVSDADMEKGQMRCDVNINIKFEHEGQVVKTPITEVKNVNSTRAVERSISTEAQRQYDEWLAGGAITKRKNKITVGWDENKQSINLQRAKEEANDYRYFPEPDLPPLAVYEVPELNPENIEIPELPNAKRKRYLSLGLNMQEIETLLSDTAKLTKFESLIVGADEKNQKVLANWLINLPESIALDDQDFEELVNIVQSGEASFANVKGKFTDIVKTLQDDSEATKKTIRSVLDELNLLQKHDQNMVELIIAEVFAEQAKAVDQVVSGDMKVMGFLTGQVLKKAAGKAQPQKVQEMVKEALKAKGAKL